MKKKLVAFAVTAAMVITSAVPVFAATPATGWDNGATVDGIKVIASDKMLGGAVNRDMAGDAITEDAATYDVMIDLSADYVEGDYFATSLQFNDENEGWADQFTVYTTKQGETFTLSPNYGAPAAEDTIKLETGIYTYSFTVEKIKSGVEVNFEVVETGESYSYVVPETKGATSIRNLWIFGEGADPDTYKLDRPLVMYTEDPGYVTDVEIIDEDGEVVTNPAVGQTLTTRVTMSSGLVVEGDDSHFDWQWKAVAKNGKTHDMSATNAEYTVDKDQLTRAMNVLGVKNVDDVKVAVEVTAKNGYYRSGEATTGFVAYVETERLAGDDRYETATAVANALTDSKNGAFKNSNAVVIASGDNYCDALSGTYLAKVKNAPLLLINDNNEEAVYDYIVENLKVNGKPVVYILGGTGVVSQEFEDSIYKYNPVRLGGADRYETNLAILEEAGLKGAGTLMIASGTSYADALSAAATGNPVLLVGDKLTKAQKTFLKDDGLGTYYVVGGTAAVSNAVKNAVDNNNGNDGVTRLGGADRYATNAKVINEIGKASTTLVVASGNDFADALTGGVYAAANGYNLVLVNEYNTTQAQKIAKAKSVDSLVVIGGTAAVSDEAIAKIA